MLISCLGFAFLFSVQGVFASEDGYIVGVLDKAEGLAKCGKKLGFVAAEPCGNSYFFCFGGPTRAWQCVDPKKVFDEKNGICVDKSDLPGCQLGAPPIPSCSDGQVYSECGTACPASCDNFDIRFCRQSCVAGCICKIGLVLGAKGGPYENTCIPIQWCPQFKAQFTTARPAALTTPPGSTKAAPRTPGRAPQPQIFDCAHNPDGNYEDPRLVCSQQYISCSKGVETLLSCNEGLAYDVSSDRCLPPEFVRRCPEFVRHKAAIPITQKPVPTPPPKVTSSIEGICLQKHNVRMADPFGCVRIFYVCVGGMETLENCPEGTYFDEESEQCLFRPYVPACRETPTERPPQTTPQTTSAPRNPPFVFDCLNQKDGDYEHPTVACSAQFVSCSGGFASFRECPPGLVFDVIFGQCLEARFVLRCGSVPTFSTESPKDSTKAAPPFFFDCEGKPDGSYEDPSQVCSSVFLSCSGGVTSYSSCPANLKFDVISEQCLAKQYVKWCGGESTTTEDPKPTMLRNPPFDYDCSNLRDGDYDHPTSPCTPEYVSCSGGVPIYRECLPYLVFDSETGKCESSEFVSSCGGKPTEPIPQAPPRKSAAFNCVALADGNYAKDSCSESYFACVGGISEEVSCPGAVTVFDEDSGDCLLPLYVRGCGGSPTEKMDPLPPKPTQPAAQPSPECLRQGPGLYPAEPGCSPRYYICGPGYERTDAECSSGLSFDAQTQMCLICADPGATLPQFKPELPSPKPPQPRPSLIPKEPAPSCVGLPDGMFGNDCENSFYVCFEGQLSFANCPKGRFFKGRNGFGRCVDVKECS